MKTAIDLVLALAVRLLGGFDWLYQLAAGFTRGAIAGVSDAIKEPRKVVLYEGKNRSALTADLRRQLERLRAGKAGASADAGAGHQAGTGGSGSNGQQR